MGTRLHTGTIDGYWGLLKRGVIGSFHQISVKQVHCYLSELQFKWNHRKNPHMFMLVVCALVIGSALPYGTLIQKAEKMAAEQEPEPDSESF